MTAEPLDGSNPHESIRNGGAIASTGVNDVELSNADRGNVTPDPSSTSESLHQFLPGTTTPTSPTPPTARPTRKRRDREVSDRVGQRILTVSLLVMTGVLFLLLIRIDRVFTATTPTGGDNAGHVWAADYVKRALLPHGRIYGWSNDSFAGIPVLSSYFPLPTLGIIGLSFVMPFMVAYKLVTLTGLALLPAAMYRLAKRASLPWPESILLAMGVYPFLLARHFRILGGNIMSTMAGEYSFSISMLFTVLYMGSLVTLMRTHRGRIVTTIFLACTGLSHIVPSIFAILFTASCFVFELRRDRWKRQVRDLSVVGVTALAISAYWVIPFGANLRYSNSMDYEKNTRWFRSLVPILPKSSTLHTPADGVALASIFFIYALIGIAVGIRRKDRFVATITLTAAATAAAFRLIPRGAMWNNRVLPLWFFCVYTLGALGLFYAIRMTRALVRPNDSRIFDRLGAPARVGAPALLAACVGLGPLLGSFFFKSIDKPFQWARGNYVGSETRKGFPEFKRYLEVLSAEQGGRMYAEPDKKYDQYGSTLTFASIGFWTKSKFQAIDGLYYEASQTTPYSYLLVSFMSPRPTRGQRRLPYQTFNMNEGVKRLQTLGVRYASFIGKDTKAEAAKQPGLRFIATNGPFALYEVRDNAIVVPLSSEPVVAVGANGRRTDDFVDAGIAQFVRPAEFPPVIAETGPTNWRRAEIRKRPAATRTATTKPPKSGTSPKQPVVKAPTAVTPKRGDGYSMATTANTVIPAAVSNVSVGNQRVAFTVDKPGTPVLVRVSWYPNWKVEGAQGPYRVAPNFMVVVPTGNTVVLQYRYRTVELVALFISALGICSLVAQAFVRRRGGRTGSRKTATTTTSLDAE